MLHVQFEGADLQGANFENSILTGSTFGKDETGTWANLKGAHFEVRQGTAKWGWPGS